MTEQPPSADDDLREWFWRCALNLQNAAIKSIPQIAHPCDADHFADDAMRRYEALCEQRVSAETERCAQIAHRHRPAVAGWALDATETIEREIRAPAERPAPEGPQQKEDLPRRIGVEQPAQETDRLGCGDVVERVRTAIHEALMRHQPKTYSRTAMHAAAMAAINEMCRALLPQRERPSALASTGEQPKFEERKMSGREVHQDDLECFAILQRRVNAGQGAARDLELIAARNDGGFHWKNDTYFKRLPDGSVRLRVWRQARDGYPTYDDRTIDPASWASIVCSVSADGETSERWNMAQDFHGRVLP